MYTDINFKTKKALIEAFKAGRELTVYQPGGFFPSKRDGQVCLEGPHYPEAHRWYASATIENGVIIAVK